MSQETEKTGQSTSDQEGHRGSGSGGETSVSALAETQELSRTQGEGVGVDRIGEISQDEIPSSQGSSEVDSEDSSGVGVEASKDQPRARISRQTFRAACIAAGGNRANIARAIGMSRDTVDSRIAKDPELNSLYGNGRNEPPDQSPDEVQVMNRSATDLPANVGVELFGKIEENDLTVYRNALRAYGVSEARLAKLKALDGLAKDWATHMAISLRGHHQSYDGQLHNLAELADDIAERLKGTKNDDGSYTPLNTEEYTFLAKVKVECVKEGGKGLATMMTLTEALVRMLSADKNKGASGGKATPGWGEMKRVRKPDNDSHADN